MSSLRRHNARGPDAVRKQLQRATAARRRSGLRHISPLQTGHRTLGFTSSQQVAAATAVGFEGAEDIDSGSSSDTTTPSSTKPPKVGGGVGGGVGDARQYVLPGLGVFGTLDIWLRGLKRAGQLDTLAATNVMQGLDGLVSFQDEGHIYTDMHTKRRVGASVTTITKAPFGEFNRYGALGGIAMSPRWRTEAGYEYYRVAASTGMHGLIQKLMPKWPARGADRNDPVCKTLRNINQKMVDSYWEEARDAGTRLHAYIEAIMNDHCTPLTPLLKLEDDAYRQFHQYNDEWVRDHDLVPFRTELNLYMEEFDLAGQADMIWQRRSDRDAGRKIVQISDWKRSKEIKYTGRGRGRPPCAHMPDCNFSHYSLQINVYRWFIENCTEYVVDGMDLVVFHPTQTTYAIHPVKRMDELTDQLMAQRLQEVMRQQAEVNGV